MKLEKAKDERHAKPECPNPITEETKRLLTRDKLD
jgi:hypothetical protein